MVQVGVGDPDLVGTKQERGTCWDCPQWDNCMFNLRKHGGFKGKIRTAKRRYIGYRLITDPAEGESAKEGIMSCEDFVGTMQDRMITGQQLRLRGQKGETISVIKQQGEYITRRYMMGINARNEVIRPMRHLVKSLKDAGYAVNLDDISNPIDFVPIELQIQVPEYPTFEKRAETDYSAKIAARERQREGLEEDAETAAWEAARAKQKAEDAASPQAAKVAKAEPIKP